MPTNKGFTFQNDSSLIKSLRVLAFPFTAIYWFFLILDRWWKFRNKKTLPLPVVSIGNISWGGTGKTPFLIHLVNKLNQSGKKVAVLSRGYHSLDSSQGDARELNDESRLMMEKCPDGLWGIGPNRYDMAMQLMEKNKIDLFILDDGFQHWKLNRDIDIVLVDATEPFGLGKLIPAGHLREPITALKRAHVVILTRSDLVSEENLKAIVKKINRVSDAPVIQSSFKMEITTASHQPIDKNTLKGQQVVALSSIGNPWAFEAELSNLGAEIIPFRFRDHHNYTREDWIGVLTEVKKKNLKLITTEKDWIKLKMFESDYSLIYLAKIQWTADPAGQNMFQKVLSEIVGL